MSQIEELTAKLETAWGTEKAELLNELGLLIHCSEPEKAESYCLQALELSGQTGRSAIGARSHFVIGIIYYMRGLYDRALENYGKVLEMYERCSEQGGLAATFRRIGLIYWNKLNFNDALNYYLKATSIREALSDKSGIAESYSDIAFVHWNRKEHDKALSYMEKSLESHFAARKIREELGDIASVYMAGILCGIGEAYKCLKMHNQAVEYYDQAYKIGQGIGYKEIMIVADSNVGDANGNGAFNGLDVTHSVAYFKGGPPPPYECECTPGNTWYVAGDVNQSCNFNGLDVTYMVAYFKGGPVPNPCPDCPPARIGILGYPTVEPSIDLIGEGDQSTK